MALNNYGSSLEEVKQFLRWSLQLFGVKKPDAAALICAISLDAGIVESFIDEYIANNWSSGNPILAMLGLTKKLDKYVVIAERAEELIR